MPCLSKATPTSRSIHGKAFSWPTATSTSSHSKCWSASPVGSRRRRPLSSKTAAARSAGADEDRVVAFGEDRSEAVDRPAETGLDAAHVENVVDLLVDHRLGQAEARDLAADHAAAARLGVIKDELVAERREV